tara:strand:- start:120095 stop:120250 length:156 start_codon:yes stop_codon:yes gene_type:complete
MAALKKQTTKGGLSTRYQNQIRDTKGTTAEDSQHPGSLKSRMILPDATTAP